MDNENNPHRVQTAWSDRSYWREIDGEKYITSCGVNDNPTRCELRPVGGHGGYPSIDFELPRQRHELGKVDRMLEMAYQRGRADNRRELGKLLKGLIET